MKKTIFVFIVIYLITMIFAVDPSISRDTQCKQVFRVIRNSNAVCNADVYVYPMGSTVATAYGQTEDSECLFPSSGGVSLTLGDNYRVVAFYWQGIFEYTGVDTVNACTDGTFDIIVQ